MCNYLSVAEAPTVAPQKKPRAIVQALRPAFTLIATAILASMHANASVSQTVSAGAGVYFEKNEGQHSSGYFRAIGKSFAVSFEEARANFFVRRSKPTSLQFVSARPSRPSARSRRECEWIICGARRRTTGTSAFLRFARSDIRICIRASCTLLRQGQGTGI